MKRFLVGTGRCGSTLLSRMLAEHPDALSIFELLNGLDRTRRFAPEAISGEEFAELIGAEQPFVTAAIRRGYTADEIIYPYRDAAGEPQTNPGSRYTRQDRMPWLLVSMLPRLVSDPDPLFDAVIAFARGQPPRSAGDHFIALFAWLGERLGRRTWLERSGSSIEYLAELARVHPDARFLHIHRDGREVALSMRNHDLYKLPVSLMYDVVLGSGKRVSESDPIDIHGEPTGDDTVSQIFASTPSPRMFGRYWCDQVVKGLTALPLLDRDQYCEVRFEDLVRQPHAELERIASLLELPGSAAPERPRWVDRAAALVRGVPPTRYEALPRHERSALDEECRAGMVLLGRA